MKSWERRRLRDGILAVHGKLINIVAEAGALKTALSILDSPLFEGESARVARAAMLAGRRAVTDKVEEVLELVTDLAQAADEACLAGSSESLLAALDRVENRLRVIGTGKGGGEDGEKEGGNAGQGLAARGRTPAGAR